MKGRIIEPYFSILMNGTSKGFFKATRVLRQGDPLSPFLFSLVANGLSAIIKKAEEARLVQGYIIGDNRIMVSHLQFADDTILFLDAKLDNVKRNGALHESLLKYIRSEGQSI